MKAKKTLVGLLSALSLFLSGCQREMPVDAYGSSRDPAPDGAGRIDETTYRRYKDRGEWFAVTKRTAADLEKAEIAQDADDEATVAQYARAHPELKQIVPADPPSGDPTVTKRADGNFDHVVQISDHEKMTVVTHGHRWWLRLVANRIRVFRTRENQLGLYKGLYDAVPEEWRRQLSLAPPDEVAANRNMTADAILALNKSIIRPEIATPIINSLKAPPKPIMPPMFLADCSKEMGYDKGSDLTDSKFDGSCDFNGNGIVRNYNWSLRQYLTCVKSQHVRGTCSAFADVAAIEILVNKLHGQRVNLSEQAFYNRARTKWDTPYGTIDGLMADAAAKGMADDAWLLYFEKQWNYNPSNSRVMTCTSKDSQGNCLSATYTKSCINYSETCSDTIHQSSILCFDNGQWLFCGFVVPEKNPNNQGYRIGSSLYSLGEFWDPTDTTFSTTAMRFYLAAGRPVVFGHPVTTAWDCAEINSPGCPSGRVDGYMQYIANDTSRGGHGICAVGFVDNADLGTILPGASPGAGGGYFIVKNSWGNCWGDGGFLYLPYQTMIDYAAGAIAVLEVL